MLDNCCDIYRNRELIWALTITELRVRYKRSALGFLWALFNPLLMMVVLTLVFSAVMHIAIHQYAVFVFSALLPWTFFSQSLTYAVDSIVANGNLLKKVSVQKLVFPVAAIFSNVIHFLLALVPLIVLLLVLGFPFYWTWFYLPVPFVAIVLFALGCGLLVATANVFFRDVTHIIQIVLSAWFYCSPIIYSLDFVPRQYRWVFRLNPMLYILNGFRLAIYQGVLPSLRLTLASIACGTIALAMGFTVFRRYQASFVYYV